MSVPAGNTDVEGDRVKHICNPFVSKLKLLLNDEKYHRAIHWSENGTAIVITDEETFKKLVLCRSEEMFKTRNFTSFVRQLNLYGFRKVPVSAEMDPSKTMNYQHLNFKRDKPELMHLVSRTCPSRTRKKTASTSTSAKHANIKHYSRKCSTFSGTARGVEASKKSPNLSPTKDGSYFNHSHSPFEVANTGSKALKDYYQQQFKNEPVAVQLLLNLRNSVIPSLAYDNLQPPAPMLFEPIQYPMYPFCPTSPPIRGPYNYYY